MKVKSEQEMNDIQTLARMYLDAQQTRIGAEHRIRKLSQANKTIDVTDLEDIVETQKNVEKEILDLVKKKSGGHLLWTWAKANAGIGEVGVMTFLGYINPFIADTAGKAKAYLGLTPNHGLKKGLNHKCNFEAKGRFYGVVLHGVIMAKHSKKKSTFYYDYYQNAKAYYANHPKVLALTKGQKGYIDNLAKRKTLALIVSHGTELMREYEGLSTEAFKAHRNYIAPII